jgi:predicted nucleic acid-binding protein
VIIVLDASPVGLLTNPRQPPSAVACNQWVRQLVRHDVRVCLPEIVDYEIRRSLLLNNSSNGLTRLDRLPLLVEYIPMSTPLLRRAAQLWAEARRRGRPTADAAALDADVILAAQAQLLGELTGDLVVVATDNIQHLEQFVRARRWQEIDA